jgi:endonuclease/exonuclease/phosphatase family metal-dependent hydrolase
VVGGGGSSSFTPRPQAGCRYRVRVPESVSVATYNLYLGADLGLLLGERPPGELEVNLAEVQRQLQATSFAHRATYIARSLVERRVDLVGLQEVCCWTLGREELWDFAALLQQALRECGADYEPVSEIATFAGEGELSLDGSRLPIHVRGSNLVLRRLDSRVEVVDTGQGLFDAALEVYSFGERRLAIARGWCGVRCEVGGEPFAFVDTHTEAYDAESRNRQRDELLAVCAALGDRLILVGDFNASPEQVGMPRDLMDAWTVNAGVPGPTCCQGPDLSHPESRLDQRIDYVWVRGARVVSSERLGADRAVRDAAGMWPSDHAGVHAVIEVG